MIPDGFVSALITYARAKGPTATLAIETELDSLFARVNAGDGSQLITGAVNGKSFGRQVNMTVQEKFVAYGEVLTALNDVTGQSSRPNRTYGDFSNIQL